MGYVSCLNVADHLRPGSVVSCELPQEYRFGQHLASIFAGSRPQDVPRLRVLDSLVTRELPCISYWDLPPNRRRSSPHVRYPAVRVCKPMSLTGWIGHVNPVERRLEGIHSGSQPPKIKTDAPDRLSKVPMLSFELRFLHRETAARDGETSGSTSRSKTDPKQCAGHTKTSAVWCPSLSTLIED